MARWFRDHDHARGIPSVSLRALLPDARFVGGRDLIVSGCSSDGRRIEPGEIYVAVSGETAELERALIRGACATIVERERPEAGPVQVIVPDARAAHARLVRALAGDPAARLRTVLVAGERSRPAAAQFLRSILETAGRAVALLGADGAWTDSARSYIGSGTFPGPEGLVAIADAAATRRCDTLIVEAPPTPIAATDLACLGPIEALIVTDLAPPPDAEALWSRRRSLKHLARQVRSGGLVCVSADDPEVERLGAVNLEADRLAYGRGPLADVRAELRHDAGLSAPAELGATILGRPARLATIGARNARGALAALALARAWQIDTPAILAGLEAPVRIAGRLECVSREAPALVVREDAETEPILRQGFAELRKLGVRRILAVAAPDGDLTPAVRRQCGALSDLVVSGADRREALELALGRAGAGDVILIVGPPLRTVDAGRPVDDRRIVADWLRRSAAMVRRSA